MSYKTLDLFAGVGGVRLGFEKAGFDTVFSNDLEEKCAHTYNSFFSKGPDLHIEDINTINIKDLPDFDILLGGFPCQAFSIAGYRQGFADKKGRGDLFFRIADIISERRPEAFLLENVKNLKSHDGGKTIKIIMQALSDLGYHVKYEVLNAMEYGNIPQNRERIYIVGFKDKKHFDNFSFPPKKNLIHTIADYLEQDVDDKYYYEGKTLYPKIKEAITKKDTVYQWRRRYVRENKSGVCPTLTANMGSGGHNVPLILDEKGIRKLTPKECFNLQGFPKSFSLPVDLSDSVLYHQAGNSVVVPVIQRIAERMHKALTI